MALTSSSSGVPRMQEHIAPFAHPHGSKAGSRAARARAGRWSATAPHRLRASCPLACRSGTHAGTVDYRGFAACRCGPCQRSAGLPRLPLRGGSRGLGINALSPRISRRDSPRSRQCDVHGPPERSGAPGSSTGNPNRPATYWAVAPAFVSRSDPSVDWRLLPEQRTVRGWPGRAPRVRGGRDAR